MTSEWLSKQKRDNYSTGDAIKLSRSGIDYYGWVLENDIDDVVILGGYSDEVNKRFIFVKQQLKWTDNDNQKINKFKLKTATDDTIKQYIKDVAAMSTTETEQIYTESVEISDQIFNIKTKIDSTNKLNQWKLATWNDINNYELIKIVQINGTDDETTITGGVLNKNENHFKVVDVYGNNNVYKFTTSVGTRDIDRNKKINFDNLKIYVTTNRSNIKKEFKKAYQTFWDNFSTRKFPDENKITISYPSQTPKKQTKDEMKLESPGPVSPLNMPLNSGKKTRRKKKGNNITSKQLRSKGKFRPRMQMSPRRAPQVLDVGSSIQLRF